MPLHTILGTKQVPANVLGDFEFLLQLHQLSLSDSIWSAFSLSEDISYLSLKEKSSQFESIVDT